MAQEQNQAGTPEAEPAQQAQNTFTSEYVSALRNESKGYRLAAKANEQALRTLLGVKENEELGDVNSRIAAFQQNAANQQQQVVETANLRLIQAEIKALEGYDSKLLEKLMDFSKVAVDAEGNVTGLKEAVEAVAEEFPAVRKKQETQTVSFGVSNEGGSQAQSINQKMNAVIRAARK